METLERNNPTDYDSDKTNESQKEKISKVKAIIEKNY